VTAEGVLTAKIREIQAQVKHRCGSPRVRMELKAVGFPHSRHRVSAAYVRRRPSTKRAFCAAIQPKHAQPIAPNMLARQFSHTTIRGVIANAGNSDSSSAVVRDGSMDSRRSSRHA
jgi:hypothetical protein